MRCGEGDLHNEFRQHMGLDVDFVCLVLDLLRFWILGLRLGWSGLRRICPGAMSSGRLVEARFLVRGY